MKQIHFSRKTRQLSRLVNELKSALKNAENPQSFIERLKSKISILLSELKGVLATHRLRKILGSVAVVFGLSFSTNSNAQYFTAPVQDPFGMVSGTGAIGTAETVDLDGDGDFDIIQGGYYGLFEYFENTGTSTAPVFGASVQNPFGLTVTYYYAFPTAADIDGDGDMDLLVGEAYGNMQYFQNVGTMVAPAFAAPVMNPFGITAANTVGFADFADLDADGDLDLLVGEYLGNLQYFQNTGNVNAPTFAPAVQNPFGLAATYGIADPTFADLDGDSDLDLLVGEYYGALQYFENTGTVNLPAFTTPVTNPFGILPVVNNFSFPEFVDLDNDADFDLLVANELGLMTYFENINCIPATGIDTQTACVEFTWIDGNTYFTDENAATFNIAGGAANGCDSIVTLNLTITTVDVNVTITDPSITADAIGATYQWLNCNTGNSEIVGQTGQNFMAAANGDYSVEVTQNGCTDTSMCVNIFTVGIDESPLFNNVSVYPSPTDGNVNIVLGDLNSANIKVYTLDGKVLYRKENITGSTYQLELEGAPGIYFVELTAQGKKQVFKVVKK